MSERYPIHLSTQVRPKPLWGAEERAKRASVHIRSLERGIKRWVDVFFDHIDWDAEEGPELHPDTPWGVFGRLAIWIGEATYNLRSALDYLVYVLACEANDRRNVDGTQFPICDYPKDFEKKIPQWLRCVPPEAVDRIRELQPFSGCEWTRLLRDLSNPDKHRNMTGITSHGAIVSGDDPLLDDVVFLRPEDRSADKQHFVVRVVVKDTNTDVVDALKLLQREVRALIKEFEPALKWPP